MKKYKIINNENVINVIFFDREGRESSVILELLDDTIGLALFTAPDGLSFSLNIHSTNCRDCEGLTCSK